MNLYEIIELEKEIDDIAKQNNGEIPEELLKELVEANIKVPVQLEKLCKYIKHLDHFEDSCNSEIERIKTLKEKAKKRQDNIKKYMTPFVKLKGRIDIGTFRLSTRKSVRTELDYSYNFDNYKRKTISVSIDKERIKKELQAGKEIPGAKLEEHDNLQMR